MALGEKHVETRGWPTNYRGPLAIHAGKYEPLSYVPFATSHFREALENVCGLNEFGAPVIAALPKGAVLAVVELVECLPILPWGDPEGYMIEEKERAFGRYDNRDGQRYAWLTEFQFSLDEPIPAQGHQRIWNLPTTVLLAMTKAKVSVP